MPQTVDQEQRPVLTPGTPGNPEVTRHADAIERELEQLIGDLEREFQKRLAHREAKLAKRIAELEAMLAENTPRIEQLRHHISELQGNRSLFTEPRPRKLEAPQPDGNRSRSSSKRSTIGRVQLPKELTVCSLERLVADLGFEVKNHRARNGRGGGLWVFCSEDALRPLVDQLEARGVNCRYYYEGERRRDPRAAWELDRRKILEYGG